MTKANRPSNLILDFENKFLSNGSFKEEIPMDVAMNLAHQIVNTPPPTPKKPILSVSYSCMQILTSLKEKINICFHIFKQWKT